MQKLRKYIREILLTEALTKTEEADVQRIAKKQAEETTQKELEKAIKDKKIREEIALITKEVIRKLFRELSVHKPYIIDQIKIK